MVRAGTIVGLSLMALLAPASTPTSQRPGCAGDAACLSCHQDLSRSYAHTAHHLTSQLPSSESILGPLSSPANTLTIVDPTKAPGQPGLSFTVSARGGSFFETATTGFPRDEQHRTEPIDIVTGSGHRGQTYLSWQGERLFELPISYWAEGKRWINSPGYPDGTADFSRPVQPGCIECHATYLQPLSADPATNRFERTSFTPGISCESCHGPAAAHVAMQAARPPHFPKPSDELVLNPARFSRDRQIDLCALCHNGIQREPLAPAFSYFPGKPLAEFFKPLPVPASEHPDVHGNQVGLLQRSRCYIVSPSMTCSTCHDTHASEQAATTYSAKCLTCHTWQSCGVSKTLGHTIASNCIDCHMPVQPTSAIVSETAGEEVHATMRTHWIKVYPDASLPAPTPAASTHP